VTTSAAVQVADALAAELRIREEVERRIALLAPHTGAAADGSAREHLRETYAELRSIAAGVQDPPLRERLGQLERRLAGLARTDGDDPAHGIRLTSRETDVLAQVGLGSTNAEIAGCLALKETTVMAYLQSAMAKLDASTRHSAVAKARRAGLLP
jgi:DNA-binding NarL/FixJ family response regulator